MAQYRPISEKVNYGKVMELVMERYGSVDKFASALGLTRSSVYAMLGRVKSGKVQPTTVAKLAKALGVGYNDLIEKE